MTCIEARELINADGLRRLFHYNPLTGIFTRLIAVAGRGGGRVGDRPGWVKPGRYGGYLLICVERRIYRAHRLAWLYMTGNWPSAFLDHVDLNKKNNIFSNLREATPLQYEYAATLR